MIPFACRFLFSLFIMLGALQPAAAQRLTVSENGRFLTYEDGRPFFYLGDTAWELFHRLDLEEAGEYLENRASKGFTVIQAVVLAQLGGLTVPNANGDLPLEDKDPRRPVEAYFRHVDAIVDKAEALWLEVPPARATMRPLWYSILKSSSSTRSKYSSKV